MLEKDIESALCRRVKFLGGLCEKFGVVSSFEMPLTAEKKTSGVVFVTYSKSAEAIKAIKQLDNFKPEDLGVDVAPRIKTLKVAEPAKRSAGIKVPDVATLVDKLKNVAKVI
jgi:electron transfer flavoprotein beta subunit